jgi:pimeloyl-ACP methyl ester carboxylesterase
MTAKLPCWNELYHLGLLARDAYTDATLIEPMTDTQARITAGPFSIVVAFRGSSSLQDWITNAQFRMEELLWADDQLPACVHRGFLRAMDSVNIELVATVRELLAKYPQAEIHVIGHSLGGALAMLAAYEFYRLKLPVASVVTFGAPRVGNKAFAVAYNSVLKDITFNIVAQGDPVPLVPGLLLGYRDCGTEYFIKRSGELLVDPWIGAELFTDVLGTLNAWRQFKLGAIPNHNLNHYLERISQLV